MPTQKVTCILSIIFIAFLFYTTFMHINHKAQTRIKQFQLDTYIHAKHSTTGGAYICREEENGALFTDGMMHNSGKAAHHQTRQGWSGRVPIHFKLKKIRFCFPLSENLKVKFDRYIPLAGHKICYRWRIICGIITHVSRVEDSQWKGVHSRRARLEGSAAKRETLCCAGRKVRRMCTQYLNNKSANLARHHHYTGRELGIQSASGIHS